MLMHSGLKGNPVRIRNNRHYCIWQVAVQYAIGFSEKAHSGCDFFRSIISQDICRVFVIKVLHRFGGKGAADLSQRRRFKRCIPLLRL